jgi:Ca2+-binding RTX toxin-like protein
LGGGLFVFVARDTSTINIYNNIVWGNTATSSGDDIFVSEDGNSNNVGAPVNLFHNDFADFFSSCDADNTDPCTPNISAGNNINEDPLFVDAENGDVHIQSDSPTKNAGESSAPSLPSTDFEGDPRIFGAAPDMGADEFVSCAGRGATIHGTPGDDIINGTPGPDIIRGLGGRDIINGRGGNDIICGDFGNDTLLGGLGNDRLFGGAGSDTLLGGDGDDELNGGDGDDTLDGGEGHDTLNGEAGIDVLFGGDGKDTLMGRAGTDVLFGGHGNDTCNGGADNDEAATCEVVRNVP